ncbi:hypothetical protein [Pseudomonas sp. LD120]|uniref:hypothetical protein n=1 Tax=Pseudomonas sp. LD120 TaxID=485751 RepID=UPI00135819A1|nr:hypothetical protein [Pseudomonas sp. LD120]KAF0865280.1 hypothetical protein PLD_08300 [Pseudomonas sp. LD120]
MNSALLMLNATAIAALLAFHFLPAGNAELTPATAPHHNPHQTPQLAVISSQAVPGVIARATEGQTLPQPSVTPTESWVF